MSNGAAFRLCSSCTRRGACWLGFVEEVVDLDDATLRMTGQAPAYVEGGPGVVHGGWTAAALDEVSGHLPRAMGLPSVTGTLEVTYVKPVPIIRPLVARSWVERRSGRRTYIVGEISLASSGAVLARSRGIFVQRDEQHHDRFQHWLQDIDDADSSTADHVPLQPTFPNEWRYDS